MDRTEMGAVPLGAASWPVRGLPYQAVTEGVKAPLRKGGSATVRRCGAAQVVSMGLSGDHRHVIYMRAMAFFKRILPGLGNGPTDRLATLAVMYVDDPDYFK